MLVHGSRRAALIVISSFERPTGGNKKAGVFYERKSGVCVYVYVHQYQKYQKQKGALVVNRRREPGSQQNSTFCQHCRAVLMAMDATN